MARCLSNRLSPPVPKRCFSSCSPSDRSGRAQAFADFLRVQLQKLAGADAASLQGSPVLISGMASSSIGWRELAYAPTPLNLDGSTITHESFDLSVNDQWCAPIHLISGVRTENDMMRGEECELLGVFADGRYSQIAAEGIVVLPGTHSKHARLRHRQLIDFQTYITGELFDVLATHSVLKASAQAGDLAPSESWAASARPGGLCGWCLPRLFAWVGGQPLPSSRAHGSARRNAGDQSLVFERPIDWLGTPGSGQAQRERAHPAGRL